MSPVLEGRRLGGRARWRGALAGLIPAGAIAVLFAVSGTTATPAEVAVSLGLVALITTTAGWLAGPLAAAEPRRLLVAAIAYAIALLAVNALLAIGQAAADSASAAGVDAVAIGTAVVGRAAIALVGTAYLLLPALGAGAIWSVVARVLGRLDGRS